MKSNSNRANKAQIYCVLGASGSGKTTFAMRELQRTKPRRLLIWDTKGEFAREGYAIEKSSLGEVAKILVEAGKAGGFSIAYRPNGDAKAMKRQFNTFCLLAFHRKSLTLVAEELADVTTANHAPEGWRKVTSQGRTEGVTIYGLSQHPASIDKHFFGNASYVRTGRLNYESHVKAVANVMGVTAEQIRAMLPLEWLARDMNNGKITQGKLTF